MRLSLDNTTFAFESDFIILSTWWLVRHRARSQARRQLGGDHATILEELHGAMGAGDKELRAIIQRRRAKEGTSVIVIAMISIRPIARSMMKTLLTSS